MHFMFSGLSKLTTLDVSNFDTHNVENMEGIFDKMVLLETLDITNFDQEILNDLITIASNVDNISAITSFMSICLQVRSRGINALNILDHVQISSILSKTDQSTINQDSPKNSITRVQPESGEENLGQKKNHKFNFNFRSKPKIKITKKENIQFNIIYNIKLNAACIDAIFSLNINPIVEFSASLASDLENTSNFCFTGNLWFVWLLLAIIIMPNIQSREPLYSILLDFLFRKSSKKKYIPMIFDFLDILEASQYFDIESIRHSLVSKILTYIQRQPDQMYFRDIYIRMFIGLFYRFQKSNYSSLFYLVMVEEQTKNKVTAVTDTDIISEKDFSISNSKEFDRTSIENYFQIFETDHSFSGYNLHYIGMQSKEDLLNIIKKGIKRLLNNLTFNTAETFYSSQDNSEGEESVEKDLLEKIEDFLEVRMQNGKNKDTNKSLIELQKSLSVFNAIEKEEIAGRMSSIWELIVNLKTMFNTQTSFGTREFEKETAIQLYRFARMKQYGKKTIEIENGKHILI